MDYTQFAEEMVNDTNHLLLSEIDKTLTNNFYSVEFDSQDNSITIIFEEELENQNDTVELMMEEMIQGINRFIFTDILTVILLKHTTVEDILAELIRFELEGDIE